MPPGNIRTFGLVEKDRVFTRLAIWVLLGLTLLVTISAIFLGPALHAASEKRIAWIAFAESSIAWAVLALAFGLTLLSYRNTNKKLRLLAQYYARASESNAPIETLYKDSPNDVFAYLNCAFNKALEERRIFETAKTEEERSYLELFDIAPIAIYRSALDGRMLSHNRGFSDLLGYDYKAGSLCIDYASSAYADPADREKFVAKIKGKGSISNERLCLKKKQGDLIWVNVNAVLLKNPEDSLLYINGFLTDISYLMEEHDELLTLAETDALTGIANRRAFMDKLETACSFARAHASQNPDDPSASVSLLMFDLDNFKQVNDQYGHDAGDEVLKTIARIGKSAMRKDDIFARLGGDEFVMLVPKTELAEAKALADRFVHAVTEMPQYASDQIVTVSIGISSHRGVDVNAEKLLRESDSAMYNAKQNGRNRVCTFV